MFQPGAGQLRGDLFDAEADAAGGHGVDVPGGFRTALFRDDEVDDALTLSSLPSISDNSLSFS
jgi:hypothetical protein